jgi:hypothetical protein
VSETVFIVEKAFGAGITTSRFELNRETCELKMEVQPLANPSTGNVKGCRKRDMQEIVDCTLMLVGVGLHKSLESMKKR